MQKHLLHAVELNPALKFLEQNQARLEREREQERMKMEMGQNCICFYVKGNSVESTLP